MKQFCQECGKEARTGDNSCIHCGTALRADQVPANQKQQMSKGKKLILSVIIGIALFITGFSVWANVYQSPESVQKRFETAISKDDHNKIKKMLMHEDGSAISEQEARAFLKLVKEAGSDVIFGLTSVVKHGKFLGVYEKHKIKTVDQFALYENLVDGLIFTFNDKEFAEHEREGASVVYGPIVPGMYTVKAVFKGEYGETTMEDALTLNSNNRQYTWIGMEVPVAKVRFYIENYNQFDLSQAYIQVNEEKIPVSKEGETAEIGPFILDGSQEVRTVVSMPWGEVISEPFMIDDAYIHMNADLILQDQYQEALAVLTDFGEQYVEALSKKDTKVLKGIAPGLQESIAANFDDDMYYSGKLDAVEINKNSIYVDINAEIPAFYIYTRYTINEDYHELTEIPDLHETYQTWNIGLSYDLDEKEWLIQSLDESGMRGNFEVTDERVGSKELHGPSKEAIAQAEKETTAIEIQEFIFDYTQASVDAINYRDFDFVDKYITADGPRRKEAREYIDYLDSKDIYEDWYGSDLEKVEKIDENTWEITVVSCKMKCIG